MPGTISPLASVKALTFDVLGTTVDWRSSVADELELRVHRKLVADPSASDTGLSPALTARLQQLRDEDATAPAGSDPWTGRFAAAWHRTYLAFSRAEAARSRDPSAAGGTTTFKTVDEHFLDSLSALLSEWQLAGLFSQTELQSLSLVYHRLSPWPDTVDGLERLAAPPLNLETATLTNGNSALIRDLNDFGAMGFSHLFCAEVFHAYKPAPEVYLGAAQKLGLRPEEVAMVAAHMTDLDAARRVGFRTVYVERSREEEDWPKPDGLMEEAKDWVDLWIKEGEDGFVELAKRLQEIRQ